MVHFDSCEMRPELKVLLLQVRIQFLNHCDALLQPTHGSTGVSSSSSYRFHLGGRRGERVGVIYDFHEIDLEAEFVARPELNRMLYFILPNKLIEKNIFGFQDVIVYNKLDRQDFGLEPIQILCSHLFGVLLEGILLIFMELLQIRANFIAVKFLEGSDLREIIIFKIGLGLNPLGRKQRVGDVNLVFLAREGELLSDFHHELHLTSILDLHQEFNQIDLDFKLLLFRRRGSRRALWKLVHHITLVILLLLLMLFRRDKLITNFIMVLLLTLIFLIVRFIFS